MTDEKKPRLFIRNGNDDEPWTYCGELSRDEGEPQLHRSEPNEQQSIVRAIGNFILYEVMADADEDNVGFDFALKIEQMTDAEIVAMPEC